MRKTVNLTRVNGCYSKELREMTPAIKLMLKEPSITTDEMKQTVIGIIEPAFINATAKERFTKNLLKCRSKEEIDHLCYDAVLHGMYYHPKTKAA